MYDAQRCSDTPHGRRDLLARTSKLQCPCSCGHQMLRRTEAEAARFARCFRSLQQVVAFPRNEGTLKQRRPLSRTMSSSFGTTSSSFSTTSSSTTSSSFSTTSSRRIPFSMASSRTTTPCCSVSSMKALRGHKCFFSSLRFGLRWTQGHVRGGRWDATRP